MEGRCVQVTSLKNLPTHTSACGSHQFAADVRLQGFIIILLCRLCARFPFNLPFQQRYVTTALPVTCHQSQIVASV